MPGICGSSCGFAAGLAGARAGDGQVRICRTENRIHVRSADRDIRQSGFRIREGLESEVAGQCHEAADGQSQITDQQTFLIRFVKQSNRVIGVAVHIDEFFNCTGIVDAYRYAVRAEGKRVRRQTHQRDAARCIERVGDGSVG